MKRHFEMRITARQLFSISDGTISRETLLLRTMCLPPAFPKFHIAR